MATYKKGELIKWNDGLADEYYVGIVEKVQAGGKYIVSCPMDADLTAKITGNEILGHYDIEEWGGTLRKNIRPKYKNED